LHDIGKIGVPDALLLKPEELSEEERQVIKRHPLIAYEMLSDIPFLRNALDIPFHHHEKWDGTGYPHGLRGEQIPLAARIFAIVDAWDALCSARSHRSALSQEKAREYIQQQSGKHFDPRIVKLFMGLDLSEDE
jgi:HD-GYP domain-containing protein (c-di-GMP phosphodiesterase class II)